MAARQSPTFAGYDLEANVPGLKVVSTDPYRFPTRALITSRIANTDKSVTSSANYTDKKLNVTVEIGRDTRELLEASLDTLNSILQGHEQALVVPWATSTRQWLATLDNIAATDVLGGHGTFDLEFECADPIGSDVTSTQLFSNNLTGSSNTVTFTVGGTCEWQQPIITITFSALTGGTTKAVTIGNSATGQSVSVTRTWAAADILIINATTKKITVNGTEVQGVGAIPEWAPGAGSMDYSDTLTTRTRQTTAIYYKRYV